MLPSGVDIALPLLEVDRVRTRHFADLLTQVLLIWFPLIAATILIGQDFLGHVVACDPHASDTAPILNYVNTLCGTIILQLPNTIYLLFASAASVSVRQMPLLFIFQALLFRLLIFVWDISVGDKLNCVFREWNALITELTDTLRDWYKGVHEKAGEANSDLDKNCTMPKKAQNIHPLLRHALQLVVDAKEMLTDWLDNGSRVIYLRFLAYTIVCFLLCTLMSIIMGSVISLLPQTTSFNCTARGQHYDCVYRHVSALRVVCNCNMGFFMVSACAHLCVGVYLSVPMSPLESFFCHKVAGLYCCLKDEKEVYHRPKLGLRLLSLYMAHNKSQLKDLERLKPFARVVKDQPLYNSLLKHISQHDDIS